MDGVGTDHSAPGNAPSASTTRIRQSSKSATLRMQANALFRKNASQQRRSVCTNIFIILTPVFFCVLLYVLQLLINNALNTPDSRCGCLCLQCCSSTNGGQQTCRNSTTDNPCQSWEDCKQYDTTKCGFEYSSADQVAFCSVPSPAVWPALFTTPSPAYLSEPWRPAAAMLITGDNASLVDTMQLFPEANASNSANAISSATQFAAMGQQSGAIYAGSLTLLGATLGTYQKYPNYGYFIDPAFIPSDNYNGTLSLMSPDPNSPSEQALLANVTAGISLAAANANTTLTVVPLATQQVWVPSADDINQELYCGYKQARCNGTSVIEGITNAWDFGNTNPAAGQYSMRLWYNGTGRYDDGGNQPTQVVRVHAAINVATNAFLKWALGMSGAAQLVGIMEMPKPNTKLTLDIASLVGTLFYTWLLQILLPVMLAVLVSEKEGRLRTMMKMHGLDDGAYWGIQYIWYFIINFIYTWVLIGVGTGIGLSFFTRTSYSFQFVFYFLWMGCLVSFTFLLSTMFKSTRTAVVVAFLYVFGTGLVGYLLLQSFVAAGQWWTVFLELVPGFGLYRGLYEIAQYAFRAAYQNTQGITWSKLGDHNNGLIEVMIIFAVESVVFLLAAWYIEKVLPGGIGVPRHPLFCFGRKFKADAAPGPASVVPNGAAGGKGIPGSVPVGLEPEDVAEERARVEAMVAGGSAASKEPGAASSAADNASIVIRNLRKQFPGRLKKIAVRDLTMAVARGECFGLLGPNGAGKSTTINILTGFLTPSSGSAVVEGYNIVSDMDKVYHLMGVCPQDNLLWPRLTAREHLLFYGRLKNLKGAELKAAVEAALRSVNLFNGGVADKQVQAYSGGMKRRLSVAISLIGNPLVVYMDEPSTGLDPASRQNLWDVVKAAKPGRGIILTTHSMEEAAALCDRLGIFVDGQLVCIGAPKELTARYGGYYVFTITTPVGQEKAADALVFRISPHAKLTYSLAGTRRYELPVDEVTLAEVFAAVDAAVAAQELTVLDWGVANATLEEVFIRLAKDLGVEGGN